MTPPPPLPTTPQGPARPGRYLLARREALRHTVAGTARELLRTALLVKLAVDLADPVLARRAARQAAGHARLLSGLSVPPYAEPGDDDGAPPDELRDQVEDNVEVVDNVEVEQSP